MDDGGEGVNIKEAFFNLLGNEQRQNITIPLLAIGLSLCVSGVLILLLGKNPLLAGYSLFQGAGILPKATYAGSRGMLSDFMNLLNALTPMVFAALAVGVALKAGLFNIGVSGQMLAAAFGATVLVGYTEALHPFIAKPAVLLIGVVLGGAVGGLIGFLKQRFNINEVVSSIMLNYILMYTISFFINTRYIDPVSRQSRYITQAARLTLTDIRLGNMKMVFPLGIFLAVAAAFAIRFLLDKTRLGYEIKAVGSNRSAASYAGIHVGKNIMTAMAISGALAGLAGVCYYLGFYASIAPRVLSPMGFDAIAVSLLANSNPVGILFSSLLITTINTGSAYMSSAAGIQQEIASVFTAIILLFSACSVAIRHFIGEKQTQREEHKG